MRRSIFLRSIVDLEPEENPNDPLDGLTALTKETHLDENGAKNGINGHSTSHVSVQPRAPSTMGSSNPRNYMLLPLFHAPNRVSLAETDYWRDSGYALPPGEPGRGELPKPSKEAKLKAFLKRRELEKAGKTPSGEQRHFTAGKTPNELWAEFSVWRGNGEPVEKPSRCDGRKSSEQGIDIMDIDD